MRCKRAWLDEKDAERPSRPNSPCDVGTEDDAASSGATVGRVRNSVEAQSTNARNRCVAYIKGLRAHELRACAVHHFNLAKDDLSFVGEGGRVTIKPVATLLAEILPLCTADVWARIQSAPAGEAVAQAADALLAAKCATHVRHLKKDELCDVARRYFGYQDDAFVATQGSRRATKSVAALQAELVPRCSAEIWKQMHPDAEYAERNE
jgi:hypothetical protein